MDTSSDFRTGTPEGTALPSRTIKGSADGAEKGMETDGITSRSYVFTQKAKKKGANARLEHKWLRIDEETGQICK